MPGLLALAVVAASSLLPNGGFEKLASGGAPAGWTTSGSGAAVDDAVSHSGKRSLRIFVADPSSQGARATSGFIAVSGRVRAEAWIKTRGVMAGAKPWNVARVYFNIYDADRKPLSKHWGHYDIGAQVGTKDWTRYTVEVELPAEVRYVRVICSLAGGATGTAWFDDVSLVQLPGRPAKRYKLRVVMPELRPVKPAPKTWPDEVEQVRIEGDQIARRGRPVFLLGAWSLMEDTWLCRALGLDYTMLNMGDFHFFCRRAGEDTVEIGWGDGPWIEQMIRDALEAGLMVRADMSGASERASHLRPVRELVPEIFVPFGHYANFCPHHPQGLDIYRAKFAAWIARTRKYPIWQYKVFNELWFLDYCQHNIQAFRQAMKAKYGTIQRANQCWGTKFSSFDEVQPPRAKSWSQMAAEQFSVNLWVDWLKFCERDNIESLVRPVVHMHRELDPRPGQGYRGVQSHCNLLFDYNRASINPWDKARCEDYYSHETAGKFYRQVEGTTSPEELESMLRFELSYDVARSAAPDKPIICDENYFTGTSRLVSFEAARQRMVVDLAGRWRFRTDPDDKGLGEGWQAEDYNDARWASISVPGAWEQQGQRGYDGAAWYRRTFAAPAREKIPSGRAYLVIRGADDRADIYLNGELIGTVRDVQAPAAFDITDALRFGRTNTLAIRVTDSGGLGGLRGPIFISSAGMQPAPLTPGQMRARIWAEMIHGASATVIGYTSDESWGLFNPNLCSRDALKALPFIKNNINALGEIVLPRPRIKAQVALVYPLETLRMRIPRSYDEFLQGLATRDIMRWYLALVFSGINVDVISCRQFIDGAWRKYKAVFFPMARRVPRQLDAAVEKYLQAGGVVLLDYDSFMIDDETGLPRKPPSWLGPRWESKLLTEPPELRPARGRKFACQRRLSDGTCGSTITALGGDGLYWRADGKAWLVKQRQLPGYVFYCAIHPDPYTARFVARLVCGQAGVRIPVRIDDAKLPYVERHLLGQGPRRVVWLCNWGAGEGVTAVRIFGLADGRWRVRAVPLNPRAKVRARVFSRRELETGALKVRLASQEPVILLLELESTPPLRIPDLPAWQRRMLAELWRPLKPKPRMKYILCDAGHYARVHPARIPTAVNLLYRAGFYMHPSTADISPETLAGFDACFMFYRRIPVSDAELRALREFVQRGGGLLLCANAYINWHNSNGEVEKIASMFGLHVRRGGQHMIVDRALYLASGQFIHEFRDIRPHPITAGVRAFWAHRAQALGQPEGDGQIVVAGPPGPDGQPTGVIAATEFGKGRVVLVGDANWLLPQHLEKADNRRLLLNIARWLCGAMPPHEPPQLGRQPAAPPASPAGGPDPIVDVAE